MADIKRLLNKKGWTGRELGIIQVTNMAIMFRQALQGNPDPKPLIEWGQLRKMINGITGSEQARVYNGYISIHEWLRLKYNIALSYEQQAELRFKTLSTYITEAMLAEDVYQYIERLPLIMTEKQYEDFIAEKREDWLKGEDRTGRGDSAIALIYRAIEYYINLLSTAPKKQNPLKPIRKKYLAAPIESPFILSHYNEATDRGYWILEDGRRSDQMTDEEWQKAIATPKIEKTLAQMNEEQQQGLESSLAARMDESEYSKRTKLIYFGMDSYEARKELERQRYEAGLATPAQYVLYDEPPAELTKWEVLEDTLAIYELFAPSIGGGSETTEEYVANTKIFVEEFRELVELIIAEIDSKYFVDAQGIAATPIEEWEAFVVDWTQLYEKDYYGFRAETDDTFRMFDGNWRATRNGVAVIKHAPAFGMEHNVDENGYYLPPDVQQSFSKHSLQSFFTEAEDFVETVEDVEDGREGLLDSYYLIKGYNTAIDLIAKRFDIPEIEVFKLNLQGIERRIEAYNELIPMLYTQIYDTDYEDKELKQRKLQVVKEYLTPIDYKSVTIPAENIEAAKALFEDFRAFRESDIADLLFYRPHEETEDEGGRE